MKTSIEHRVIDNVPGNQEGARDALLALLDQHLAGMLTTLLIHIIMLERGQAQFV